ncbi:hypothetical protein [Flavobacterium sp. AG291]|uniref:hypothetical protein n=1 Tax=Flavobacterium sp. AG291 TaxID=2184000 RepID=UPI000E0C91F4|nr:hypothetical protein [Flavobacterium sp. AG291]RDI10391.1 hypothetical protein DEU42_10749 [Flavobacterium sp. AG291]
MINFSKPKHPFLILAILLLSPIIYLIVRELLFEDTVVGTYGINKTIGWAWDLSNFMPVVFGFSVITSVVGYGFLVLFKARINSWITIIQMLSLVFLLVSIYFGFCTTGLIISILSLILFFINVGFAIACKMSDKNKRLEH